MLAGKDFAGPAEAALDLVSDEENAMLPGEFGESLHVLSGCRNEATFPQLQFHDDSGDRIGIDQRGKHLLERVPACHTAPPRGPAASLPRRTAIAVGIRNPVDLRSKGAKTLLVWHHLRSERHRQIGASVEAVLQAHHRGAAR